MPRPAYRSRSYRRIDKVSPKKRHLLHYKRHSTSFPHCGICGKELNGISIKKSSKGSSLRSNSRIFGGVLCASCTADVVKLASRIENGEMKLNDIGVRQKGYVLQMIAH